VASAYSTNELALSIFDLPVQRYTLAGCLSQST
jgi:hypothetical protein